MKEEIETGFVSIIVFKASVLNLGELFSRKDNSAPLICRWNFYSICFSLAGLNTKFSVLCGISKTLW